MLRVKHNTAKKTWACSYCTDPILPGQRVQMIQPFRRPATRRHADCPRWKNSELESSEGKAACWEAVEQMEEAKQYYEDHGPDVEALQDLVTALEEAAAKLQEAAELHRESASNLESGGFVGTAQVDELNEWADNYDNWAVEIEQHAADIDPNVCEEEEEETWLEGIDDLIGQISPD